jgi:MFS family permease
MLLDISPLVKYRDYRYLFAGQLISVFGSMITYVALPFQIYELTHSTLAVGIVGLIELIPLLITAFIGGVFADTVDRKKLLIFSEISIMLVVSALAMNAALTQPKIWIIYCAAGLMSALNGFHRPALDSLGPRLVEKIDIPAYSALNSFKSVLGTIAGPAIGGICIAAFGWVITYLIDIATFAISIIALLQIKRFPGNPKVENTFSLKSIKEGLHYAISRQELIGTYVIDFVAMVFSMPNALFPAMAESYGKTELIGLFYAAPAVGALIATIFSGWTAKVYRQGIAIVIAASCWGLAITGFGFVSNVWLALCILAIAGGADMISGIFRSTIWNQTIPSHLRGRLAGIEMIGYQSGPLLGNTQAGMLAAGIGTHNAIMLGGVLCITGVGICASFLPKFLRYDASTYNK